MLKYTNIYKFYGDAKALLPSLNFYINKIENDSLHFIKINHAFWDMLAGHGKILKGYISLHDKELIKDDINIVKNIHKTNIILAVNPKGGPINTPEEIKDSDQRLIYASHALTNTIPSNYIPHHAGIWKIESRKDGLKRFFDVIKKYQVIVVGLQHLYEMKKTCNLPNFKHYVLSFKSSRNKKRFKILNDLIKICGTSEKKIVLIQAGDLFATWLVYNLATSKNVKNCSVIDMGRSLDFYCPNRELSDEDSLIVDKINILKDFHYLP